MATTNINLSVMDRLVVYTPIPPNFLPAICTEIVEDLGVDVIEIKTEASTEIEVTLCPFVKP